MALNLTDRTLSVLQRVNVKPQYVLEIDGISTIFTATEVEAVIKIGDTDLLIGDDWVIGGFRPVSDQSDTISLSLNTTEINQQLMPDKGAISSISSLKISLVDFNDGATELITPGLVVEDMLARRAKVYLGFEGTSYPEDFVVIFRGIVDDIESSQGAVQLNISHPDQKKRNTLFEKAETQTDGSHNDSITTITVNDTTKFLAPVLGPSGVNDTSLKFYIRIEDEIIEYTGKTGTTFTGCTRGALSTLEVAHDDDCDVSSFYRLTGNGVELALKIMLSGWNGPFEENAAITNFVRTSVTETVANAIFFYGINVREKYGVNEGDYITTTGASNGANNVTLKVIDTIVITESGSYMVIAGVTFVEENSTAGVIDFRSQYDTLGEGIGMHGDEVDVDAHLVWYTRYLSSFDYDFYLKDTIEGKEFVEKQLYLPMGAYSLPRKSRSSMGYHTGPIPSETIKVLDNSNIKHPEKLTLRRSLGKNFYNTIIYQFDQDKLEDKYLSGHIETDADSKARIAVGNRSLVIKANGMRRLLFGASLANIAATRMLSRYRFGAEYIDSVEVLFKTGFSVEPGDIVLFDGSNLNISDTSTGARGATARFYEVINKKMNIKTGNVTLSLVNTNFSTTSRYGLISPASKVAGGTSGTVFTIKESYSGTYGVNEYRKWERYIGCSVKVRNSDFSVSAVAVLQNVVGNTITLATTLGFTPLADYVMELSEYNDQTDIIKLLYTFMTDEAAFDDGLDPYLMI